MALGAKTATNAHWLQSELHCIFGWWCNMLQISSIDASWLNSLWLPCTMNQCTCPVQVQRSVVQKINASTTVCLMWWRLAAYSGCWLRHHGHIISSDYDELLRIPDHSVTAESYGTNLVTHVHWNHSIYAQVPVKRSDVQNTNASTCIQHHQLMVKYETDSSSPTTSSSDSTHKCTYFESVCVCLFSISDKR